MAEFTIEVEVGKTVRLPTAGKYCDRDIVITATGADVVGTWVFNDDPDLTTMPSAPGISFVSNGTAYSSMNASGPGTLLILMYNNTQAYVNADYMNYTKGWTDEAYKTIEILEAPTGLDFGLWLQANATKV